MLATRTAAAGDAPVTAFQPVMRNLGAIGHTRLGRLGAAGW
ncbi:MAG TPA: hypothetical protein VF933_04325 [Streptosporangiaceae bacterium]